MRTVTTVDIEVWTRYLVTSGATQTGYTLLFTDTTGVKRIATRETEFEARQFARVHGWVVNRVFAEGDDQQLDDEISDAERQWRADHPDGVISDEEAESMNQYAYGSSREENDR